MQPAEPVVSVPYTFLWLNNTPLYKYTTFNLLFQQVMDIWGCFHVLTIMSNVANNILCLTTLFKDT